MPLASSSQLAKEQFFLDGSKDIVGYIDEAGRKAGLSRGQAFEDFLTFVRCSLAGQTMEEEYLAAVHKGYEKGKQGKRGIDVICKAFATLVMVMEETKQDILGDVFQGAITYGEAGQFFTPESITEMMSEMVFNDLDEVMAKAEEEGRRPSICDPCSGSGRMLLSVANRNPNCEFTGVDVDHRCAQMTAINLGLRNLYGYAVWGNSLTLENHRAYRTGLNLYGGVIREVSIDQAPVNSMPATSEPPKPSFGIAGDRPVDDRLDDDRPPGEQLELF